MSKPEIEDAEEDARRWDEQIANHVRAGRLNALIAQAKAHEEAGECHELTPGGRLTPRPKCAEKKA